MQVAEGPEALPEARRQEVEEGEGGGGEGGAGGGALLRGDALRRRPLRDLIGRGGRRRGECVWASCPGPGPEHSSGAGLARRHRAVCEDETGAPFCVWGSGMSFQLHDSGSAVEFLPFYKPNMQPSQPLFVSLLND